VKSDEFAVGGLFEQHANAKVAQVAHTHVELQYGVVVALLYVPVHQQHVAPTLMCTLVGGSGVMALVSITAVQ